MAIRINLLAEAQALEELRRRDPVKRAIWVGVVLLVLMLAWSGSLQFRAMMANRQLARLEAQLASRTNEFQVVLVNQKKLEDVNHKLGSLRQLATNRFLNGTVLNALQQSTIDDVQLMRFKADQGYTANEETRSKTNANGKITPGKPASVTEKVLLTLEAKDSGATPGDQVNRYVGAITDCSYFQNTLGKTNLVRLTNLLPLQSGGDGKPYVLFTLQATYPEKTR